ncbi:MAG: hypothetical protein JRI34_10755 [Deltaproteobacteria bacterium]|nr:hypothetical protein [Deltaproteobacteria bacterium]
MIWVIIIGLTLVGFLLTELIRRSLKKGWSTRLVDRFVQRVRLDVKFGSLLVFIGLILIAMSHALKG